MKNPARVLNPGRVELSILNIKFELPQPLGWGEKENHSRGFSPIISKSVNFAPAH